MIILDVHCFGYGLQITDQAGFFNLYCGVCRISLPAAAYRVGLPPETAPAG
jgi:hypothetical protein